MRTTRRWAALAAAGTLATAALGATPMAQAQAATCGALTVPIYQAINPATGTQLLSPWENEVQGAKAYGFTQVTGLVGYAAPDGAAGHSRVVRMFNGATGDFVWLSSDADIAAAQARGYAKQNVIGFSASTTASSCAGAAYRLTRGTTSRIAMTQADADVLVASGWTKQGVAFHIAPVGGATTPTPTPSKTPTPTPTAKPSASSTPSPSATLTSQPTTSAPQPSPSAPTAGRPGPGDDPNTFSIAIIGDTQTEVLFDSDRRFANRTQWLAANKDALDLRYVLQTGDLVNWGWLVPAQYTRAKAATDVITKAGIPYAGAIGNHDTRAVGWDGVAGSTGHGGSAYASNPECPAKLGASNCQSWQLVRGTDEFKNSYPTSSLRGLGGAYENGRPDNVWTTFSANGTDWMVLTLELWPRKGVVDWAKQVVASHPQHNVIIQTHHYLDGNATISGSNGGYGETSPRYLYDQVVAPNPNVKIVASGHVGGYAARQDVAPNGNTVVSYLGNDLGDKNNPVRIVTINTATGKVDSVVNNPIDGSTKGTTGNTITIVR